LARSGVTFTEVEKERIKALVESNKVSEAQILILEAIETQVGGTALATANASDRIRVGFTQVQERIGMALLPAFEKLTSFLLDKLFPAFEQKVLPIVRSLTEFIETKLVPILQQYLVPILNNLRSAFTSVSESVKTNEGAIGSLVTMFVTIFEFANKYLVPIIKYQLTQAISGLGLVFKAVGAIALPIIEAIAKAITFLVTLIDSVLQKINGLIKAYNSIPLLPDIPTIGTGSRSAGSNTVPSSSLPFGAVSLGGLGALTSSSLIASSSSPLPSYQSGNVTVNVNAPSAIDEEGFTRAVVSALNSSQLRLGGGGSQLFL
jgi:hypothetical protein